MTNHNMQLDSVARSDIGARDNQEDRYYFNRNYSVDDLSKGEVFLAIVADGMGGHSHGEVASEIAITAFSEHFYKVLQDNKDFDISTLLDDCINLANSYVVTEAKKLNQLGNMGTTLCAIAVKKDKLYWVNTGDSRIHRIRDNVFTLLSRDFTFGEDVKQQSIVDPDIRMISTDNPEYYSLTSHVGMENDFRHAMNVETYQEGDYYLISSDGFYDSVDGETIIQSISSNLSQMLNGLFDHHLLTNMDEDQDNATAILLHFKQMRQNKTVVKKSIKNRHLLGSRGLVLLGILIGATVIFAAFKLSTLL